MLIQIWKAKCWFNNYWVGMLKNVWDLLDHRTLKSGVSYKWFDEPSWLIEWFLHADSDWTIWIIGVDHQSTLHLRHLLQLYLLRTIFCFCCRQEHFLLNRNLGVHPAWLLNSQFQNIVIHGYYTPQMKNSCNPSYCFLTPQFQNFINMPIWIFWGY